MRIVTFETMFGESSIFHMVSNEAGGAGCQQNGENIDPIWMKLKLDFESSVQTVSEDLCRLGCWELSHTKDMFGFCCSCNSQVQQYVKS